MTTQEARTRAAPEPVAAWLRVAERRISGRIVFTNQAPGTGRDADTDGEGRSGPRAAPVRAGVVLRVLGGELAAGAAVQAWRLHRTKARGSRGTELRWGKVWRGYRGRDQNTCIVLVFHTEIPAICFF